MTEAEFFQHAVDLGTLIVWGMHAVCFFMGFQSGLAR